MSDNLNNRIEVGETHRSEQPENNDSPPQQQPNKESSLGIWVGFAGVIIGATIGAIGAIYNGAGVAPAAVPPTVPTPVAVLPESNSKDNYTVLKDISIFDLRSWTPLTDTSKRKTERISPVNYTNYLHIKKLKEVNFFTGHYATSGFGIDLRCITHKGHVLVQQASQHHKGAIEYAIQVDISEVPVGTEALIVIEGTYWNGFRGLTSEDASTYTDSEIDGLKELGLVVFLPEKKPFTSIDIFKAIGDKDEEPMTHNIGTLYKDESKLFVYWSVGAITANTHYRLKWDW